MKIMKISVSFVLVLVLTSAAAAAINLEDVEQAIDASGADWVAADNIVADMHFEHGWYDATAEWPWLTGAEEYYVPSGVKALPDTLDWRDYEGGDWITPIRDQESCGSCWAFGSVATIEAHMAYYENLSNPQIDLAEQQLLSCAFNLGCSGGGFTNVAFSYAEKTGLVDEECFPYQAEKVSCAQKCADWQQRAQKIQGWQIVSLLPNKNKIMDALQNGPVATSFIVYDDFYYYSGGVYTTVIGYATGMHVVSIVGYNKAQRYWICKNSWGDGWGEDGYFRIRWGAGQMGLFTVLPVYDPPRVAARNAEYCD